MSAARDKHIVGRGLTGVLTTSDETDKNEPESQTRFRVIDQDLLSRLLVERDALRAVLTEIVREFRATYDASNDGGAWKGAAQIDARVMERAAKLVDAA